VPLTSPATLVAGRVAALADTLAWFVPGDLTLVSQPPSGPLAADARRTWKLGVLSGMVASLA
jgi:hypothetical protein